MATTRKQAILRQVGRATVITLAWALLLAAIATQSARAQTFKSLYSFTGGNDGAGPDSPIIWDPSGNLYGTAGSGADGAGNGNVFELSPNGQLTVLYPFPGQGGNGENGAQPQSVVREPDGTSYGITFDGGYNGLGVIFKLSPSGEEIVIHNFQGPPSDGAAAMSAVLLPGQSGLFYGVASEGGNGVCITGKQGYCGVVFTVDTSGNEQVIHNFQGSPGDGMEPIGRLVRDTQGNLYGTTFGGGSYPGAICGGLGDNYGENCGAVFKLSPNSDGTWAQSLVHSFNEADGAVARSLAIDAQGNLYGIATFGGSNKCPGGCGTLYKIDTRGAFTLLHTFIDSDGKSPQDLVLDATGDLYGSTLGGNPRCGAGCGVLYKFDAAGKFTILHKFNGSDGYGPGFLNLDETNGTLYGATGLGGAYNWGTIFEFALNQ